MSVTPAQIGSVSAELNQRAAATPAARADAMSGVPRMMFFLGVRLAFGGFLLLTSVYILLLYIPFTYFGFIQNPLLGWLPVFVRIHSYLFAILLGATVVTLLPDLRAARTWRSAAAFVVLNGGICIYLMLRPALGSMLRDLFTYVWGLLCLFPLMWLAALDLAGGEERQPETSMRPHPGLNLSTTTFAALAVAIMFAATSLLQRAFHEGSGSQGIWLRDIGASLIFHLVIFTAVGAVILAVRVATRRAPWPERTYLAATRVMAWMICFEVIRHIALPTISFEGIQANLFAAVFALALVAYASGIVARLRADFSRLTGQDSHRPRAWLLIVCGLGLLAACYVIPAVIGRTDWDFVLQKIAVLLVWLTVVGLLRWAGAEFQGRSLWMTSVVALVFATAGFGAYKALASSNVGRQAEWTATLDSYAGSDVSFKTAYDILSRSLDNEAYDGFYRFLRQNTNLGRDVTVGPADTRLVSDLKPTPGEKPNIFVFVIDSLRQDYISPYNSSVTYTPEIGNFARDSVVMQKAFTRYAGTALSEPAIWVGAMQLHKQYIKPFYPMNNLQKLLDTEGYQSYISVDPILQIILRPSPSITELDKDTKFWGDLDFIPTLKELQAKIEARADKKKPIFAYTQPQNVHTLTLERSRRSGSRRDISIYELQRMDAAFGEFVRFLQRQGLYDNSIIILTSDHGDSYGEFGRYGHADFLFPEIIKIPLIVHLPPRMRDKLVWDTQQIAFNVDITPSLYYLLGHRPAVKNELFGRPLFTQTREEQAGAVRSEYLIASSYAPVYGILGDDGRSLFIADAVNRRSYFYNLTNDLEGVHNRVTPQILDQNDPVIRKEVTLIDRFYGYTPASH
ncbi:MAG: sulfatase-like hydrolase/transferase [Acidobacteriia bacterium]|nr:sulfatase-like hydrolase/transferase [Terriglobia bacterium]